MPNIKSGYLTTVDYRVAIRLISERLERLGLPGPDQQERHAFFEGLGEIKAHLRGLVDLSPNHAQATLRVLLRDAAEHEEAVDATRT